MKLNSIGESNLNVTPVCMGCWALAGGQVWGQQDKREAVDTVHAALDSGINFFDTAEAYGDGYSEEIVGKALEGVRDEVVIASKARPAHMADRDVIEACENSLKRLRTETIDLYQIHWPVEDVPFCETYDALQRLQSQGKIREIGISNFGVRQMEEIAKCGAVVTNQLPYNLLWRAIEFDILEFCRSHDIGVLCYSSLAQGLLTGKFRSADEVPEGRARTRFFSPERPLARHGDTGCEDEMFEAIGRIAKICDDIGESMAHVALSWLLHQGGVTSVIAGARRPDQIRDNVKAATLELSPDVLEALRTATHDLKEAVGNNPDMWETPSRIR